MKIYPMILNIGKVSLLPKGLELPITYNSVAFQFDIENPPRLERTIFSMRKHRL